MVDSRRRVALKELKFAFEMENWSADLTTISEAIYFNT